MFAKLAGRSHVGGAMMLLLAVFLLGASPRRTLLAADHAAASPSTLAVTTTADRVDGNTASFAALVSNPGADARISLREALVAANKLPSTTPVTITFSLASEPVQPDGTQRIRPDARLGNLPPLARGFVVLDATSSPGPLVLDGGKSNLVNNGLTITSSSNKVLGLAIVDFLNTGIVLQGRATDNLIALSRIERNYTGVLLSGTGVTRNHVINSLLAENEAAAVELADGAHANIVGGTGAEQGNTIRANAVLGVYVHGAATDANVVAGNTITEHLPFKANPTYPIWINDQVRFTQITQNTITGNQYGIRVDASSNNEITANNIGVAPDGITKQPNTEHGVMLFRGANNNVVGGLAPHERNVITANGKHGVYIYASTGNLVQRNYIGVGADGVTEAGNGQSGVWLRVAAQNTIVENVIAANGAEGIKIDAPQNVVTGNKIGVGADGLTALPNRANGVWSKGDNTVIGPGNIVSHHAFSGIVASGRGVRITGNIVESNRRGVCASGAEAVISDNTVRFNGVTGSGSECGVAVGGIIASGGQSLISDNIVHSNLGTGVMLLAGNGNRVLTNSITDNSSAGIALSPGVNGELAAPTIMSVQATSVDGTSCVGCAIELFTDDDDEGRVFLGETIGAADGTFSLSITREMLSGARVSATATDANGNTSAFATPFSVPLTISPRLRQAYFPFVGN